MITDETVKKDILWGMYQENVTQGRYLETLRANVTSSLIAIYAAIIGVISFDKEISQIDIPLTFLLMALGIFGALFVFKHYERYALHMQRARNYRNKIDELFEDSLIKTLKTKADDLHKTEFPKFHKFRLKFLWIFLHLVVVVIGIILSVFAVFSPLMSC